MLCRMDTACTWGTTAAERLQAFPCYQVLPAYDQAMWRGVTVAAPAAIVFRWLCQLRVAPYSYDWIRNGARRSPQQLVPGLDQLAAKQTVMTITPVRPLLRALLPWVDLLMMRKQLITLKRLAERDAPGMRTVL